MLNTAIQKAVKAQESKRSQEITSTGSSVYLAGNILPQAADALTAEEGIIVLKHMNSEPAIASSDFILRAMVMECGWSVGAAVEEPSDKGRSKAAVQARRDYAIAEEVRQYIARMIDRLETPFAGVLWQALEAWGDGHKLFEQVRDFVTDDDGAVVISTVAIKPKPRLNYRFVVTRYMDMVGVIPEHGGLFMLLTPDDVARVEKTLVEPGDLFVFSLRGEDGDPRGSAAKRAAYDAWRRKQLAKPESLLHMQFFGSGKFSIEGPAPTKEVTPIDKVVVGDQEVSITDYIQGQAQFLANNGFIILPDGWSLKDHFPTQGGGVAFEQTFDRCDREMVMAFLTVTRATQEAQHGSKADSNTAEGLLGKLVTWLREMLSEAVRDQVFSPAVRLRFGEDIARRFTPKMLMRSVEKEDVAALLTAVAAAFASGIITPEQLPYWDRRLGQPEREVTENVDDTEKDAPAPEVKAAIDALAVATGEDPADIASSLGFRYEEVGPSQGPTFR